MRSSTVYLISGLGADQRAFSKLVFPPEIKVVYLDWIPPKANESLSGYARRLAEVIDQSTTYYLIGLSFGGMLATEITRIMNPVHTFLISSIATYKELPWYYRAAGRISLQKALPVRLLKNGNNIGLRFLGAKTDDELLLLKQLVRDSDPYFMKWALTCILSWRNLERPQNITQIHGTSDNILPMRYTAKQDFVIEKAGHFMVYADGDKISDIIMSVISNSIKS